MCHPGVSQCCCLQHNPLPSALHCMPLLTEQRRPQVGAVWQPQRHAACGHLLAGAAGGSPGGRRAVERPTHAAQAAETPRGPESRKRRPEERCGGDRARARRGGRRKEGRLREDVGGPSVSRGQNLEHANGGVDGQRSRSLRTTASAWASASACGATATLAVQAKCGRRPRVASHFSSVYV